MESFLSSTLCSVGNYLFIYRMVISLKLVFVYIQIYKIRFSLFSFCFALSTNDNDF